MIRARQNEEKMDRKQIMEDLQRFSAVLNGKPVPPTAEEKETVNIKCKVNEMECTEELRLHNDELHQFEDNKEKAISNISFAFVMLNIASLTMLMCMQKTLSKSWRYNM